MFFILPQPFLAEVTGKHASRYLNARFTNNIRDLSIGAGCAAAALTPQGKIEVFVITLRTDTEKYLLYVDGGDHGEILKAIKRFIVADRVDVLDISSTSSVLHLIDTHTPLKLPQFSFIHDNSAFTVSRTRSSVQGVDIIASNEIIQEMATRLRSEGHPEWDVDKQKLERLKAGILSFPEELNSEALFSESGLNFAVSFTKGCYVGQEVVEKIDAYGKSPRVLKTFTCGGAPLSEGQKDLLLSTGDRVGEVITIAHDTEKNVLYGILRVRNDEKILSAPLFIGDREIAFLTD